MAEAVENTGNEQAAKKRPAKKSPRIDMTPMVDLAFLLLTFFVLTSNLQKPTSTEIVMPADPNPPTEVDNDLTQTILIDGNANGNIYYYSGFFKEENGYKTLHLGDNSLRKFITEVNAGIQAQFDYLNTAYQSTRFTQENYNRLDQYVLVATTATTKDSKELKNLKADNYAKCAELMTADLKAGTMSEATFKVVGSVLRGADNAPFFVVKWGDKAKYGDVINVIDELKIGQVSKYAVVQISDMENEALMHH